MKKFIVKVLRKLAVILDGQKTVYRFPSKDLTKTKGIVLLSYITEPFIHDRNHSSNVKHSNRLAAWDIVDVISAAGYEVHVIDSSKNVRLENDYDVLIGTLDCLVKYSPYIKPKARKIFYALGTYVGERNGSEGELKQVKWILKQRNKFYVPKRLFENGEIIKHGLEIADEVWITGGESTEKSFPAEILSKSNRISVPIYQSTLPDFVKSHSKPCESFLWFFGYGQVHKGLHLAIEAFIELPQFTLHICGTMEPDFELAYGELIKSAPNIHVHGFVKTDSSKFLDIVAKCSSFVAPTVNEGVSVACATLIKMGLYPVMSSYTGVDIPLEHYSQIKELTVEGTSEAVLEAAELRIENLNQICSANRELAETLYSPSKFREDIHRLFIRCET